MERTYMEITPKKTGRLLTVAITAILSASLLSGCEFAAGIADLITPAFFRVMETMTESQTWWIIFGETILIVFLVLLVILVIALFLRYRKIDRQAQETRLRENALREENEMLNRLNQTKTEFLQNMSHDFKTPLTIISTSVLNAMDMLDFELDKEELRETLSLAQSEIKRVSRIVDNAMKQTAMKSERLNTEPVDLTLLFIKVKKTFSAYLGKNGNTLITHAPKVLPPVLCHSDTLLNILANLISNSNRYTRRGQIVITAEPAIGPADAKADNEDKRSYIAITVTDTGLGVDPGIMPDIFKRGASTKNRTGLGLPICKQAVESLGGTITIESLQGHGTKVRFTVPVYVESKNDAEESLVRV